MKQKVEEEGARKSRQQAQYNEQVIRQGRIPGHDRANPMSAAQNRKVVMCVCVSACIFSSLPLFYVFIFMHVFMHMQISLSIEAASNVPTRDVLGLSETVCCVSLFDVDDADAASAGRCNHDVCHLILSGTRPLTVSLLYVLK